MSRRERKAIFLSTVITRWRLEGHGLSLNSAQAKKFLRLWMNVDSPAFFTKLRCERNLKIYFLERVTFQISYHYMHVFFYGDECRHITTFWEGDASCVANENVILFLQLP